VTFQKGQSGNPAGRKKGKDHKTLLIEGFKKIKKGAFETVLLKAVAKKMEQGDPTIIKLMVEMFYGKPKQINENINMNMNHNLDTSEMNERLESTEAGRAMLQIMEGEEVEEPEDDEGVA